MTGNGIMAAAAIAALAALAGCAETGGTETDSGLSGTTSDFEGMTGPCRHQASNLTGVPRHQIEVTDRLQTGGGPLLTLSADGTPYSCRKEADGSVTVFSEFAN